MKERDAYRIPVHRNLIDVTREVYVGFYQERRKAKTINEKNQRNGVLSYDALDTDSTLGEEAFQDSATPSLEEVAEEALLRERLHQCLGLLTETERELIDALYFEGLSERKYAARVGKHYMTIHDQKVRILRKMKKLMEN